jgi:Tol biopolymer transport system component
MSWQQEFERLKPQIESALAYNAGTQSLEEVKERLENGSFRLWSSENSVLIIESQTLGGKQYVIVALGGGNLEEIKEMLDQVEKEAKTLGFDGVMIIGRRGWGKVLPSYGEKATVFIKEI